MSAHLDRLAGSRHLYVTTVFANNIHCPSCVSHIKQVAQESRLGHHVLAIEVSVVAGEIILSHDPGLPINDICHEISEAGFEVEGATTMNGEDSVVSEVRYSHAGDGLLEDATEKLRSSLPSAVHVRSSSGEASPQIRMKRKRHTEICLACQEKEASEKLSERNFEIDERTSLPSDDDCDNITLAEAEFVPIATHGTARTTDILNHEKRKPSIAETAVFDISEDEDPAVTSTAGATWVCELGIGGMTCSACTNSVQDGLRNIEQVSEVTVSLLTNSALVVYTGSESDADKLVEAVEDLGFEGSIYKLEMQMKISPSTRKASNTSTLVGDVDCNTNALKSGTKRTMEAKLSIGGMTCSACTNAATLCLKDLPFVRQATVSLMTNSADVQFEGEDNLAAIVDAVEDVGFDCIVESTRCLAQNLTILTEEEPSTASRQVQVEVKGFFCEHCPGRVVESLERHHQAIKIDRAPTQKHPVITLTYTPDLAANMTIRDVVKAVQESDAEHFQASIYHPPSVEERSRQVQSHERRRLLVRLIISTLVAIPTLIIGVVCMSLLPGQHETRKYFMKPIWSGIVPRAQWALLFLATPVYFFAADVFHKRAIKEIRALWNPRSRVPIIRRFTKFGSMNLLVSAGTTVAYVSSLGLLIADARVPADNGMSAKSASSYFDTVVFLTFFILIGRFLEAYSKSKAGDAISLLGNRKPQETILANESLNQTIISADLIEINDRIVVPHGQSPAADGALMEKSGLFDESSLTGEAKAVRKEKGDEVFTGTINVGPPVTVTVTKVGGTSMLDQIINVVREGQTKRAPVEHIADLITGYFVPVITALAIVTFVVWVSLGYSGALDRKYLGDESGGWAFWSLEFAIAVFVVACPCGIGLAAPTALFVGGGLAAKHGILARGGGQAFQDAGKLDAIVFDKTGTLTEGGDLKVTDVEFSLESAPSEHFVLSLIHELESPSAHPIAVSVAEEVRQRLKNDACKNTEIVSKEIVEVPGKGMEGSFDTQQGTWKAKLGSPKFIGSLLAGGRLPLDTRQQVDIWEHESKTVIALALQCQNSDAWTIEAILAIEDVIRSSAQPAVVTLRKRGMEVYMLTGDNWATARAVAIRVGIKPENVFAGVLPTEKADKIEWLQNNLRKETTKSSGEASVSTMSVSSESDLESQQDSSSVRPPARSWFTRILARYRAPRPKTIQDQDGQTKHTKARVAFVGDGINDAPALTRADISISPSSGAPIATNSSSFILMSPSLLAIPRLFDISTKVFRRVKFNFAWALVYNVVLVPVAAGVFFRVQEDGFRLGPVWGSLAMAMSSVSVVVSSLLLRWEQPWPWQWCRKN